MTNTLEIIIEALMKNGYTEEQAGDLTKHHKKSSCLYGSRMNCVDIRYNINDEHSL